MLPSPQDQFPNTTEDSAAQPAIVEPSKEWFDDMVSVETSSAAADVRTAQELAQLFSSALRHNVVDVDQPTAEDYLFGLTEPSFSVDQESGARWDIYERPNDPRAFTIITSSGREIYDDPTKAAELSTLLEKYQLTEEGGDDTNNPEGMRFKLGEGQEATVYSMGPYAVREEYGIKDVYVAIGQLQRMNAINGVMEQGLPRWLNLPPHYAMHTDPIRQKTYTIMQRVDGGLTVEDVLDFPDVSDQKLRLISSVMDAAEMRIAAPKIRDKFDEAYTIIADALIAKGLDPEHYLTDWQPRNVLVAKLKTPVAKSDYSLNVIDQYRA